jgi:hypothetical protein
LSRDVERGQGSLIDEAADAQAVADLVAREAVEKFLVEGCIAGAAGRKIAFDDEMLPDRGDLGARVARTQRDLLGHELPAAGRRDFAIALNGELERGDRALAHERHVEPVVRAQAVVEIGADLLAARLLVRRDGAAIGEAAIGIETLREGYLRRRQHCGKHDRRECLRGETLCGAPSCRAHDGHSRKSVPRSSPALRRHKFRPWCQKMDDPDGARNGQR